MSAINFLPYDPQKIGGRISFSGEHAVYRYGQDEVIKFPSGPIYKANSQEALDKITNDFHLVRKYFRDFVAPAYLHIFTTVKGKKTYCIIQEFVTGRPLQLKDMENPAIKEQLETISQINQTMHQTTHYALEFFGITNLIFHPFTHRIGNIFITPGQKLKIIDFGFISDLNVISSFLPLYWVVKWAFQRQKKLLQQYLG